MADNVVNRLTINAPSPEELAYILEGVAGKDKFGEPLLIDLNRIKPMPASLHIDCTLSDVGFTLYRAAKKGIERVSPESWETIQIRCRLEKAGFTLSQSDILRYIETDEGKQLFELGRAVHENVENHGAKTWLDWRRREWQTIWNAFGHILEGNVLTFRTWACVPELMAALASRYPITEFHYEYADKDWGTDTGDFTFKGDVRTGGKLMDSSPGAKVVAERLLGPYEG